MSKKKVKSAYIIRFEKIEVIGNNTLYQLEKQIYPILGIEWRQNFVDIKTKQVYPILGIGEIENMDKVVNPYLSYVCHEKVILKKLGVPMSRLLNCLEQQLLDNQVSETVEYLNQLSLKPPFENIVPYQHFKEKRKLYRGNQ